MEESIQNRVVSIALPLQGGKHFYFSGFVLADGLIITCRHGFAKNKNYDPSRVIEITSQSLDTKIAFTSTTLAALKNEDVILFESKAYDVVLLKCSDVKGLLYPILKKELSIKSTWSAGGYPYFNRDNKDTKGYKNFSGVCEAVESKSKHLTLKVETALPKMKHWQEASGSPVFINQQLAGIVRRYTKYDDNDKKEFVINKELQASYLKRLWEGKGKDSQQFRKVIEQYSPLITKKLKARIRELLDDVANQPMPVRSLAIELSTTEDGLLDTLLCSDQTKLIEVLHKLKKQDSNVVVFLERLLYMMLSYQFSNDCHISFDDTAIINVPIARGANCEFIMAAYDGRDPEFNEQQVKTGDPRSIQAKKYNMTSPPEYGIHANPKDAIIDDLRAGKGDINTVRERIFGDYDHSEGFFDEEDKRFFAKKILENAEGTYYWVISVTSVSEDVLNNIVNELPIKILRSDYLKKENKQQWREKHWQETELLKKLANFIKG